MFQFRKLIHNLPHLSGSLIIHGKRKKVIFDSIMIFNPFRLGYMQTGTLANSEESALFAKGK